MTTRRPLKKRNAALAGLEALNSFKVPKKAPSDSVLQPVSLESPEYVDEILPEISQSFRFPQLIEYLQVNEAWLVHNRALEQAFTGSRKRLQRNTATVDASYCTGFCVQTNWTKVESVASEGFSPGNCPETWLGQPEQGVTLNQCADLTVARTMNRLSLKSQCSTPPCLFLIIARWPKSRAYLVAAEAEQCEDRLEPQPGHACHVSTWSRRDLLDPAKISLERAFRMAQVYLYEFDEDLELCPKPGHVLPFAVVKCQWRLNTQTALNRSEPLNAATGSILIVPTSPLSDHSAPILTNPPRPALLPTPHSISNVTKSYKTAEEVADLIVTLDSSVGVERKSNTKPSFKPRIVSSSPLSSPNENKPEEKPSSPHIIDPLIKLSRRLHNTPDLLAHLTHQSLKPDSCTHSNLSHGPTLLGVTLLTWGHPSAYQSLSIEVQSYKKGKLPVFDGLFQPCLRIARLVSLASIHYELAGLTPSDVKSLDPAGPPVLVSIPREQEWCLPRLNASTASSLRCKPSPFAGYRGNYFRLTLHHGSSGRTDLALLCQTLCDKSMAGVIHVACDESSILFVFPDCPFARSIGFPPADSLHTNYLHAILLTPHSLEQYPFHEVNCLSLNCDTASKKPTFLSAAPVPAPTDLIFGQRKNATPAIPDTKLKIPLDTLLSSLPDGGKDLLGTALIALLASKRSVEPIGELRGSAEPQSPSDSQSFVLPRLDPRLCRGRQMDTQSLASTLLSTVARNPEAFKAVTPRADHSVSAVESELQGPDASSPSGPLSPVDEPTVIRDEPKEIPLSSSSPRKQPIADDDMEVEFVNFKSQELQQSSDMDISSSIDYQESPLKFYPPRHSYRSPRVSGLKEPLGNFGFFANVNALIENCRNYCSVQPNQRYVPEAVPISPPSFDSSGLPDGALTIETSIDQVVETEPQNAAEPLMSDKYPRAHCDETRRVSSSGDSAVSSNTFHSPDKIHADANNRLEHKMFPSPVLVLEDISKSHPYFKPTPKDESEEGEVVDDDPDDDVSECEKKSAPQTSFEGNDSRFSTDFTRSSLNIVDEWPTSSRETCVSVNRSRSPKRIAHRRSPSPIAQCSPVKARYHRRPRANYPNPRNFSGRGSRHLSRDNLQSRSRHPDSYRPIERSNSSYGTSDSSVHSSEAPLEDEDMRIYRQPVQQDRRGLLPLPDLPVRNHRPSQTTVSADRSRFPADRDAGRSSYLGTQDVDYRRLADYHHHQHSTENRLSSESRTAANESRRLSSPGSTGSDHGPKYSVYRPKADLFSSSQPVSSSKNKFEPIPVRFSNRPTSKPDPSNRAKRKPTVFREPPTLLPSTNFPASNPNNVWMTHVLQHAAQFLPPPWK